MFAPAQQSDRLAELENTVRRLEAAFEGSRRAGAETVTSPQLRPARTGDTETSSYPRNNTYRRLPFVFCDWTWAPTENAVSLLEITARSDYPLTHAQSPIWLPPEVDVEVAMIGGIWRIVRWPAALVGKTWQAIGAAEWVEEEGESDPDPLRLIPGAGTIHVCRRNDDDRWEVQYWDEDKEEPVLLNVINFGGEVAADKGVVVTPDADHEWNVAVEPCGISAPT